jgi:hypothetical protein
MSKMHHDRRQVLKVIIGGVATALILPQQVVEAGYQLDAGTSARGGLASADDDHYHDDDNDNHHHAATAAGISGYIWHRQHWGVSPTLRVRRECTPALPSTSAMH